MPNGEGEYEQDGRLKIGAPTFNGRSDTNAHLGIEYPPMGMSNNTKMMMTQAPMVPPLLPQSNPNMGSYRPFRSSHQHKLSCASHSRHGGTQSSKPSLPLMPLSPLTMTMTSCPQSRPIPDPTTARRLPLKLHPHF